MSFIYLLREHRYGLCILRLQWATASLEFFFSHIALCFDFQIYFNLVFEYFDNFMNKYCIYIILTLPEHGLSMELCEEISECLEENTKKPEQVLGP